MIFIDEMKNLKIYRKQFFLPYNDKDKKHGSAIYLLTPNYVSSKKLMNTPLTINRRYFESYYFERNAAYYINTGKVPQDEVLSEAVQSQIDSSIHNDFDYESFDEFMLLPVGTIPDKENNTYYQSVMAAIVAGKLDNGNYCVYVHPVNHPEDPTCIGTIAVQVIQYSFYDAFYRWIDWEYIEDEGEYLEEAAREDVLYNRDKFQSGNINLCFITGLSGSGKSTMAKGIKDAEHYELDDLLVQYNFSDDNLKEYGDLIYSFFKGPGKKYREVSSEEGQTDKYEEGIVRDFIKYAKSYSASHKNKKFIIEGVELLWFIQPSELKDYAVFIKGTSASTSMTRSSWRDSSDASNKAERVAAFAKTRFNKDRIKAYKDRDKDVQNWINYYSNLLNESIIEEPTDYLDNDYTYPILNRYNVVSRDGANNCVLKLKGFSKPFRGRSSMIIYKEEDNKIYIFCEKKGNEISVPGGGWDPNETPLNAAIREAREEVNFEVSDIMHIGHLIECHNDLADWVKENVRNEEDQWYGYYSEIFVGKYNGEYNYEVEEIDKDDIKDKGEWVLFDDIKEYKPKEYINAINTYFDILHANAIQESFVNENDVLLEQLEDILLEISQKDIERNKKLEPIFVVNTYTGTPFGKIVKKVTKDPYTHSLISFDPSLKKMYTFDFGTKFKYDDKEIESDGFIIDSIERYRSMAVNNIKVYAILVTSKVKKAIEETVEFYKKNISKTKYGFTNLLDYLKGSSKLSSFKELKLFCSEFVDSILKSVNIDISGKASRNTAPSDLGRRTDNNKFFKVYEGRASEYKEDEVEKEIEEFKYLIPYKDLVGISRKLITEDEKDLSKQLKYMVRKIKMRSKRGIYRFNKQRKSAENSLPTVDQIQSSVNTTSPTVAGGGSKSDTSESVTLEEFSTIKSALKYEVENDFFLDENFVVLLSEVEKKYDAPLRKIIWQDRMRSNKEAILLYNNIKKELPFIKYTYIALDRYQNRNIFYDLSYYNEVFFMHYREHYTNTKAYDLYIDFISRLLNPARISQSYTKKTIFIPVLDWNNNPKTRTWMYRESLNPISVIHNMMTRNVGNLKKLFGKNDIIFFGNNCYFKINFSELTAEQEKSCAMLFKNFIVKMEKDQPFLPEEEDQTPEAEESKKVIVTNIVDKIAKAKNINMNTQSDYIGKINNKKAFVGETLPTINVPNNIDKEKELLQKKEKETDKILNKTTTDNSISKEGKAEKKLDIEASEEQKKELINQIAAAADQSFNTDDALNNINDNEFIKEIIMKLASEEDGAIKINDARINRMKQLNDDFLRKEISGKTVKEILDKNTEDEINAPLPTTEIKTDSPFADQWKNLKYINFDKGYDINEDIVKMLNALSEKQYPISIRNILITDNSTSEDYVDLYRIDMEDFRGKRFTVKMDIPKFKNNKYLILRGNKKTIQNQYFNMPILKTDKDTVQIISNYNKIFVRRFGNTRGKSIVYADRIIKALDKYSGKDIKITYGDNSKLSDYYNMPIDYIDLSAIYNTIETDNYIFYFNQKEIREKYSDIWDPTTGMPFAYNKKSNTLYTFNDKYNYELPLSQLILNWLSEESKNFADIVNSLNNAKHYIYSQASILNQRIPLVIVCAYTAGLIPVLKEAGIKFELTEKITPEIRKNIQKDFIKFEDGYIVFNVDYNSSLLLNGLKDVDTTQYSLEEINYKKIYTEMLDNYGGRTIADGLENFAECMIDPITKEVLAHYKMPNTYIGLLLGANKMLSDNAYVSHGDSSSRRLRRNELIAVKVYKALFNDAYSTYAIGLRHNRNNTSFSVKQSAVIDKFMSDSISSDLSVANCLNDVETSNSITTKGDSGMNSARSYTLDKRIYDSSMLNLMGMSTGFAGTVGVTRQATMNMNIDGKRGYVKSINGDTSKMNTANSLTVTEAMNPMGSTHDDPMRVAMTFVQTSKHQVRTDKSDPLLVTNGADEVLPYLTTDIFCKKSEKAGVIKEVTDSYIVIEYADGTNDYVDLTNRVEKNSDGGFYVSVKLESNVKEGQKVKPNDIIAYDSKSFSKNATGETKSIRYDVGRLAKVAIINSDDNFEDSAMVTSKLAEDLATDVVLKEERIFDAKTNIYNFLKMNVPVQQEDILYETQTAYEEEDINLLLKNLAGDKEEISKLGRRPVKSPATGFIVDIKVYRTCELEDMSDSMRAFFKYVEGRSKEVEKKLKSLNIIDPTLTGSTKKLDPIGKLKNQPGSVLIEYYIQYHDIMSLGDKIVYWSANKGVIHNIIDSSNAPYSDFRPNEEVSAFTGIASINKRQIASNIIIGSLNKLCIELGRSVRDILGIPYMEDEI